MDITLKLMAVTVIGLGVVYFILLQVFKILGTIARRGPDVTKGICIIGGIS